VGRADDPADGRVPGPDRPGEPVERLGRGGVRGGVAGIPLAVTVEYRDSSVAPARASTAAAATAAAAAQASTRPARRPPGRGPDRSRQNGRGGQGQVL
jgi:hypothetical protein